MKLLDTKCGGVCGKDIRFYLVNLLNFWIQRNKPMSDFLLILDNALSHRHTYDFKNIY